MLDAKGAKPVPESVHPGVELRETVGTCDVTMTQDTGQVTLTHQWAALAFRTISGHLVWEVAGTHLVICGHYVNDGHHTFTQTPGDDTDLHPVQFVLVLLHEFVGRPVVDVTQEVSVVPEVEGVRGQVVLRVVLHVWQEVGGERLGDCQQSRVVLVGDSVILVVHVYVCDWIGQFGVKVTHPDVCTSDCHLVLGA